MASAGSSSRGDRVPRVRATARQKSRLRLVVVQAIVLSLFVTLFARLWYLQVLGGEAYQAQAAEQSVRQLVVQPARGLIVDDMGRPLVANRTSWVVTVDRTMLHKMSPTQQERLLRRVAAAVKTPYRRIKARTLLCGEPDAVAGNRRRGFGKIDGTEESHGTSLSLSRAAHQSFGDADSLVEAAIRPKGGYRQTTTRNQ